MLRIKDYFRLQYTLALRLIKSAGLNSLLGCVLGVTTFVLLTGYLFIKTEYAQFILILIAMSLLLKLSEKSRTNFLRLTFGDKLKKKIRIIENLLIGIPYSVILAYHSAFIEASALVVISIVLAFYSFQNKIDLAIPTPFSKKPFEFSTGFRKTVFVFPLAYALAVLAVVVDNVNLGIFSMLLIFLIALSYYSKPEKEYFVWIHAETPNRFLIKKIFSAAINASLLAAPVLIWLLYCYAADYKMILLFFLAGHFFLCTMVLMKYSAFPREIHLPEAIILAVSVYFPPLLVAVIPYFYVKSIKNLSPLLHD